jgi:hypothetical protein
VIVETKPSRTELGKDILALFVDDPKERYVIDIYNDLNYKHPLKYTLNLVRNATKRLEEGRWLIENKKPPRMFTFDINPSFKGLYRDIMIRR